MTHLLDAFRKYEIEEKRSPSALQLEKLQKLPRIGLGVTGLADYFIRNGIQYADEDSITHTRLLFGTLAGEAYKASYEIAKRDGGSFEYYDKKKYMKSPFVKNLLKEGWIDKKHLDYQAHVCKTTIAPNGTLTEIVEAGGGGVEPIFGKYYVRRERATTGDWKEWFTFNNAVRTYLQENGIEVTKENADALNTREWITAHTVDNQAKVKMMAEIQKYIDSAISVTYNLEKDAKIKDIEDIYWSAWEHGIKNVSVYREGSKMGVLITDANYEETKKKAVPSTENGRPLTIQRVQAPKRPKDLECDIHQITVNKEKHIVLVGRLEDGSIYEMFVTPNADKEIDLGNYKNGIIRKVKKGHYQLIVPNGEEKCVVDNIGKQFNETYASLSRFVSMGLRHGIDLQFVVTQLQKDTSFNSFEKAVARILKKYIQEGEKVQFSEICPMCGSNNLMFKEGCITCADCGYSRCD
jgi:ribonucleoside-diphosphate reductase alpha chain